MRKLEQSQENFQSWERWRTARRPHTATCKTTRATSRSYADLEYWRAKARVLQLHRRGDGTSKPLLDFFLAPAIAQDTLLMIFWSPGIDMRASTSGAQAHPRRCPLGPFALWYDLRGVACLISPRMPLDRFDVE
jgi:hypothetical protein